MKEEKKFKYDVAFSLLAQDEGLASEINDLLSDRYQTFLYSEPHLSGDSSLSTQ